MSQPTHEPPDPELWGRVAGMWRKADSSALHETYIRGPIPEWHLSFNCSKRGWFNATGPTWNDAARALIAEWEGRK